MFLSRFGVKNYKCLVDIDIPLTPIHVLIGQNDAGTTSVLEAMEIFYRSAETDIGNAFPSFGQEGKLVFSGSREKNIELIGEWPSPDNEEASTSYGFKVKFPKSDQGRCHLTHECYRIGENTIEWPKEVKPGREPTKSSTLVYQPNPNAADEYTQYVEAISKLLGSVRKYSLQPKMLAMPATIDSSRAFRIDPDGFGLATLLDDIVNFEPERFIKLRETFCKFFPQYASVRIQASGAMKRHYGHIDYVMQTGDGKGIFFELKDGTLISAKQASDGVVLFLAYLALAHTPNPPKLLLIEEPENGIYPQRLQEVIGLLKEMIQRSDDVPFPQIIMSTHSPYVLSMFEPEEVTFLSRRSDDPAAGVRARPMRDAPHIRERMAGGEFYLGELWYNLDEEELFSEP